MSCLPVLERACDCVEFSVESVLSFDKKQGTETRISQSKMGFLVLIPEGTLD